MVPSQGRADQAAPLAGALTVRNRRRRHREQTIDEILDVAVQVMAEEGVAGLSLSEVGRRSPPGPRRSCA